MAFFMPSFDHMDQIHVTEFLHAENRDVTAEGTCSIRTRTHMPVSGTGALCLGWFLPFINRFRNMGTAAALSFLSAWVWTNLKPLQISMRMYSCPGGKTKTYKSNTDAFGSIQALNTSVTIY